MKRLGLFVATVVFAVSLFGVISTSRVNAQTTDIQRERATATAQPTASKQDLLNSGNAVFTAFIAQLTEKQANPRAVKELENASNQVVNAYTSGIRDHLIPAITKAQGVFVQSFNSPSAASTNVYADYSTALIKAMSDVNTSQAGNVQIRTNAMLRAEVSVLSGRINTEANKQQNLYKATGNTAAASALQNAVGVQTTAAANQELAENKCSLFPVTKILGCIDIVFNWIIKNIFLEIAIFLVWITANMFNYAIQIGILSFAKWAPDALYPIWIIIRQIISLLIVFVGLYLGLMYILGRDTKFQRYIPWVIMFALFVNFSYPLARTAVDISNVVSLNIYASAVGSKALDASFSSEETAGAIIRNKLGLQSLLSGVTSVQNSPNIRKELNSTPASLMAVAFALYAAYIFFIAAIIMATRTAALVFLIVASPLLLVDSVLPMLGEKAKLLRKIFFEQLAVGPIFMIMLALTFKFLDVFQASGAFGAASAGDQTIRTFFNLLMMLIMLHIMITVTKKSAGAVGEFGTNMLGQVGGFATGAAVGVATGGAGLLARKSLGAFAAKARDSKWVTNNQDSFIGRRAYNLSNSVANSTFDLRNTAVAQKYAGKIGISSGMGAGAKMGYEGEAKKKVEEIQARSARIKTKFERDVIKDGKVIARKGETDSKGVEAKERFYQNQGGALFLTKQQQGDLASPFVDEASSQDMENYKKLSTKDDRAVFTASLQGQLEALQRESGGATSPKAQALMRTIHDIEKKDQEDKKVFDKQVKDVFFSYNKKRGAEKENYLSNQSKEVFDAVTELKNEAMALEKAKASPIDLDLTQPSTSNQNPITASTNNLREQVESVLADKPNNGAVPAHLSDLNTPVQISSAPILEFDVTQSNFAAITRAAKLKRAAQTAQSEMIQNTKGAPPESPGVAISDPTPKPPITPGASATKDPATV